MAGKNTPQPTVSDSGVREVEWYDWTAFFAQVFKPVPKITKYHRNRFSQDIVGKVTCKEFADSCEVKCCILRPGKELNVITDTMPQPIVPKGLDDAHQWYVSLGTSQTILSFKPCKRYHMSETNSSKARLLHQYI